MPEKSRTIKSTKNVIYSFGLQIGQLVINFLARTVFIYTLGVQYLGVNGLFTNILTLLSLTELGFGNAIIYSMYKPLAEGDTKKLAALMNFYKKIYRKIAVVIFTIGMLLVPFLQNIISTEDITIGMDKIQIYYVLFLLNSVVSYLFAYKSTIISADQKLYIVKKYTFISLVIQNILQVIFLLITHNYIVYLIIQIICTFGNNLYIAIKAKKMYPYVDDKELLPKKEKKKIYNNVGSIFIYKISGTILNNTDNILISMLVSTVLVGYYSNYTMIINALQGIITIVFTAVTASVGNLNTSSNLKRKCEVFEDMTLITFWILGVTSICLMNGLSDFISLWVGQDYVLSYDILIIIVVNYYIYGNMNPIWTYRDTTGIFKDAKNVSIILAILNLILSIALGKVTGMFGILLATAISRLLTTFWYQPYILYKKIFKTKIWMYYLKQFRNIAIIILIYVIIEPIMNLFTEISIINFVIKMIISFIISSIIIFITTLKDESTSRILDRTRQIVDNIKLKYKKV